jgi:hypothetical protein
MHAVVNIVRAQSYAQSMRRPSVLVHAAASPVLGAAAAAAELPYSQLLPAMPPQQQPQPQQGTNMWQQLFDSPDQQPQQQLPLLQHDMRYAGHYPSQLPPQQQQELRELQLKQLQLQQQRDLQELQMQQLRRQQQRQYQSSGYSGSSSSSMHAGSSNPSAAAAAAAAAHDFSQYFDNSSSSSSYDYNNSLQQQQRLTGAAPAAAAASAGQYMLGNAAGSSASSGSGGIGSSSSITRRAEEQPMGAFLATLGYLPNANAQVTAKAMRVREMIFSICALSVSTLMHCVHA